MQPFCNKNVILLLVIYDLKQICVHTKCNVSIRRKNVICDN